MSGQVKGSDLVLERVACELCERDASEEVFLVASGGVEFSLVRCVQCKLVYVNPRPTAESMKVFYPNAYYGEGANKFRPWIEWIRKCDRRRLADQIVRALPRGARILDFGCGRGEMLRLLVERGLKGCGVERSGGVTAIGPVNGMEILTGQEALESLPEASFDMALFLHSVEHLPHPLETLRLVRRVLKPSGRVLAVTPNVESFQAIFAGRHWFHLETPRHLFLFSPRTIRQLFARAGYRVMRISHFSLEQNSFGALQTALNVLGFPTNHLYEILKSGQRSCPPLGWGEGLAAAALAAPALVFSTLASLYQRGATMSVCARRVEEP